MKKTFFKNLFRDIKKSLSRFLSIVVIIAVGVAFYAGVRATSPDMKMSQDNYFKKNNFMDFKLVSTLGLTEDDAVEIRKLSGVTQVQGSYSMDAVIEKDNGQIVLNINSLPDESGINIIKIIRGRRAVNSNEAVVEEKFFRQNKLKLNDVIVLKSGNDSSVEDSLKNNEFTIVGTAQSPLYISEQRQLSSVGNGSVRGFVYILPEVFKSEVFTEVYVRTDSLQSQTSMADNEKYSSYVEGIEKALKDLSMGRNKIRYADVLKTVDDKLNEAQAELTRAKKEAEEKIADGYRQLDDAKEKLSTGREELAKNEALFNRKMADGAKQIEDSREQIISGQKVFDEKKKEIENGKLQLADNKKQLDAGELKLNEGKKQAAENISSAISLEVDKARKLMEADPANQEYIYRYDSISGFYENEIKGNNFDSIYGSLKKNNMLESMKAYVDIEALKADFDKSAHEIAYGFEQLAINEEKLKTGEAELNKGIAELEASKKKIAAAKEELRRGKEEGLAKLSSGRKKLQEGQSEIVANMEKLKSEEENAKVKIQDGEAEIQENRDKLKDIKEPEWYVLGRSANVGYETYRQDSDRIGSIGKVFPLIFFLVAALVSLTTMTRMVQEKRIEIGTFKALGYSRAAVASHYLIYSLSASLIGSIIGVLTGFTLFPHLIINAYTSLYTIPELTTPFNIEIALQAALVAVLFTGAASVAAALDEMREVPASLMRPKTPKSGKMIWLEKIGFIWNKLSFTEKVTARNLFRYKQRLFMTVIGIAACTGLMITGFGIREGITGAAEAQFNNIYIYNMQGTLNDNVNEADKNVVKQEAIKDTNVKSILFAYLKNSSVKINNSNSQDAYVVVPEDKDAFKSYISLTMKGKDLILDDKGVIITQKLSRIIGKKAGDMIEITINDKIVKAKVSAVTEHYIQHYIYMSPAYYRQITGSDAVYNSFYGMLNSISAADEDKTSNILNGIKNINSVGFKNKIHVDFSKSMDSVNSVVFILIISAGVLAFVVIYNLTNINITERRRELATIKLLGFFDHELAAYIYRENMILTVLGSFTGVFVGIFLSKMIMTAAETNMVMFLQKIGIQYFAYSVLLSVLFSIVVNLAMYGRFDKIDMIESLKSAE